MTVSTRAAAPATPGTNPRRIAAVAGALYLVTFLSSIPAYLLITPVLTDPDYIVSAGVDTQVVFGSILDLVNALACIGTAVALFPLLRRVHESAALGFVTTRLFEAAIIIVGVMALFTVVSLRDPAASGAEGETLTLIGAALVTLRDWSFVFGPGLMPALNALLFGFVLYRSRLVPRVIPLIGLIGAPLLASSTIGMMFGVNQEGSLWQGIATVPIFVWELTVGTWMLVKGFNTTAVAALAEDAS
jgi:hypothetical protein